MNEDLSQKVLDTIKTKKITPRPGWEFVLKDYFIWLVSLISFAIGSLAVAVMIYMLSDNGWDLQSQVVDSWLEFVLITLPYFWIVFLVLFIALAYYNFRHTKGGYKYKFHLVVAVTILASVILGIIFYNFGVGQAIDRVFTERVPIYNKFLQHRRQIWNQPRKGFLIGQIIDQPQENSFKLKSIDKKIWVIRLDENFSKPKILPFFVRILGKQIGENEFLAKQIRPIHPGHRRPKMLIPRFQQHIR